MQDTDDLTSYPSAELRAKARELVEQGEPLLAMMVRNAAHHAEQRELVAMWDGVK